MMALFLFVTMMYMVAGIAALAGYFNDGNRWAAISFLWTSIWFVTALVLLKFIGR